MGEDYNPKIYPMEILWHVFLLQTCDLTCFCKNVMLTSKYLRHQFSIFEAMFTPYQTAFAPARKPHRIELLFRHKNGDFGAISVENRAKLRRVDLESGASQIG